MPDITSANAILVLSAPDALAVATPIQGFATEDIFTLARVVPVETMMGVDGNLSAGFVYAEKKLEITLMAGSPSNDWFDAIAAIQEANLQAVVIQGVITLPSLGKSYSLINGFLTGWPPIADGRRILQPRRFETTWEGIRVSPVGAAG